MEQYSEMICPENHLGTTVRRLEDMMVSKASSIPLYKWCEHNK